MPEEDNHMNCKNLLKRKLAKCPEVNIVNYISTNSELNKNEKNTLNRKRVIQMLDLFNSKYDCKVCCRKLRYKADQIIHNKLKHIKNADLVESPNTEDSDKKRPIIKCPICEDPFTTYFHLKFHLMKNHLNEKPFGCRACQLKFFSFSRLRKHCFGKHISPQLVSSTTSSSSFSVSSLSSTSSNMLNEHSALNLIDLINYDNSNFQVDSMPLVSSFSSTNLLPNSFENPLSFNSEPNLKYFTYLDRIKSSKVKNFETIVAYLKETKSETKRAKLSNDTTFTIIVQLNVITCNLCSKLSYSNTDYLSHIWSKHMSTESKQHVCWPCVYQVKSNDLVNSVNKNSYNEKKDLDKHFNEFKHSNQKAFKCSACLSSEVYFSDLSAIKEHFIYAHFKSNKQSLELNKKTYLEEMLDLASNMDNENAEPKAIASASHFSQEKCSFVFACFKCEQIFMSYDSILKHFEESSKCNQAFSLKRIKCNKCSISLSNTKQYEVHLKQHDYLTNEAIVKLNANDNIKNSKNNKSYSIDAIVNSINNSKLSRTSNRIDDIAFKITSMKKTQDSELFNQTASCLLVNQVSSLMPLYQQFSNNLHNSMSKSSINQPILNKNKIGNSFSFNQDENINQYNSMLNKMIKSNDSYSIGHFKKPSTFYASSNSAFSSNPFSYSSSNSGYNQQQILNVHNSTPDSLEKIFNFGSLDKEPNLKPKTNKMVDQHKCEFCGYLFSSLTDFTLHRSMHQALNPKRPFKCHLCQVTFAKTDQLIRHMIVHQASDQDSVCQVCYSSFSRKQDLDRHMLFHSK